MEQECVEHVRLFLTLHYWKMPTYDWKAMGQVACLMTLPGPETLGKKLGAAWEPCGDMESFTPGLQEKRSITILWNHLMWKQTLDCCMLGPRCALSHSHQSRLQKHTNHRCQEKNMAAQRMIVLQVVLQHTVFYYISGFMQECRPLGSSALVTQSYEL